MKNQHSQTQLIDNLLGIGRENEWVEFKTNLIDPQAIGTYISALANSATLSEVPFGFLIWGVDDDKQEITGTHFDPQTAKVGNQALVPWLHAGLDPEVPLQFRSLQYRDQRIVILQVGAAISNPVKFQKTAYIRIDSHKVELARHPAYEQRLWSILLREPADQTIVQSDLHDEQVLQVLDIDAYYRQFSLPRPSDISAILDRLLQHRFIRQQQNGQWEIRTQAALLFGRNLDDFNHLGRKSIRIVQYKHDSRIETVREIRDTRGYAISFEDSVQYIMNLLPSREVIQGARRTSEPMLPSLAIREIIANALVHQDLSI